VLGAGPRGWIASSRLPVIADLRGNLAVRRVGEDLVERVQNNSK
jgi:hypothetical protein